MSQRSDENLQGIPTKPYDLLREGVIMFALVAAVTLVLAIIFGSPEYPSVRSYDVGHRRPLVVLQTAATALAGQAETQTYGPPYTHTNQPSQGTPQELFGFSPANWAGVTIPLNPVEDFVLKPLERAAQLNERVAQALQQYKAAPLEQQQKWATNYMNALNGATMKDGVLHGIQPGDYGPVPEMMDGMLMLARAGLLEAALNNTEWTPYDYNYTKSLLFFQNTALSNVATALDMQGTEMGISHETGPYPGAWWLWPYAAAYQIPPMSTSSSGDIQVGALMGVLFLLLFFAPNIPIINRIPYWIPLYRLIWRDWYKRS